MRVLILRRSIRFAPPLVISEDDLMKAVKVIETSLLDLDRVSALPTYGSLYSHYPQIVGFHSGRS